MNYENKNPRIATAFLLPTPALCFCNALSIIYEFLQHLSPTLCPTEQSSWTGFSRSCQQLSTTSLCPRIPSGFSNAVELNLRRLFSDPSRHSSAHFPCTLQFALPCSISAKFWETALQYSPAQQQTDTWKKITAVWCTFFHTACEQSQRFSSYSN